ncbi:MAG: SPOR domain-containing protein [Proteobacteria bacterium]|nr:SPOR domain-containing protein [Pseudomonadota bacterium]MBU4354404.1 SPOR domain-containing protein [Pseudomonadota bacterium]MBU4448716.1 SPOR domain-containing protein [Pseudomonadota bacterium]MCG2771981.1 SPOR domain-containing protein [Desulfobacterales bacterium]
MNKKMVSGWAVGATLILLLAVLYYLSTGTAPKTGPSPGTAPGAPTAQALPEPPAAASTQPTPQEPPAAPGIAPAGPPKGAAPSPEAHVTVPPPLEPSQHYGILAGSYKKYRDAARMLARLKKQGKPAFVQRDPRDLNRYQVWLGPFSSQNEAREAKKSLQAILKKPLKIEPIENPVPK